MKMPCNDITQRKAKIIHMVLHEKCYVRLGGTSSEATIRTTFQKVTIRPRLFI